MSGQVNQPHLMTLRRLHQRPVRPGSARGRSPWAAPWTVTNLKATQIPVAITGVTRDGTGAALGSCVVDLFYTSNDTLRAQTTSDGSGNYSFIVGPGAKHYMVAYKPGSPDLAGTTVNTIEPA